jgi:hypothetical protein
MAAVHFEPPSANSYACLQKFTHRLPDRCNGASVPDLFVLDKPGRPFENPSVIQIVTNLRFRLSIVFPMTKLLLA